MKPETYAIFDRVAKWLEAGAPHTATRGMKFDMHNLLVLNDPNPTADWCGTSCCIAGAVLAFERPDYIAEAPRESMWWGDGYIISVADGNIFSTWAMACDLLELTELEAQTLFAPWEVWSEEVPAADNMGWPGTSASINAGWAARTIRRYLELGDIRWDLTKEA